ncbi:MAG TPA: DUF11 domain-containing protein [Solirubrobacteraceae bacterium]|nr:DUF11 domain-containing protein [Solirubrobacteraceae bacterium]
MSRDRSVDLHRRHSSMIGRLVCGLAIAMLLTVGGGAGLAGAATGRQAQRVPPGEEILEAGDHIHICHALGNGGFNDPYPSVSNVAAEHGHTSHPLDIIPPFFHRTNQGVVVHYPGKNWDATGQAIWKNGCSRPAPPDSQIKVFVTCVDVHGSTYDATFGYKSSTDVSIPAGPDNEVQPGGPDRGQVTTFQSAEVLAAFTVTGIDDNVSLTWTVTHAGATSTATARAAINLPCTESPPPDPDVPIGVFVTCVVNHGATYDAVFGYQNDNADAETIPIEVGENNFFSPGDENRGQPETFLPGVDNEAVVVRGISSSVALTWTLTWTDTRRAIATSDFESKCEEAAGPPPTVTPPPTPPPPPSPQALPIGVFAVCVTNHGSHYDAMFGYVNENSEVVSVPIGSDNAVSPGPAGQGQPEDFHPGFVDRVFTVTGVSNSHAVTWTVSFGGAVRVATATAAFPHKCLTAPPDPVANAAVRKSATPGTVIVGQRVRFTISVRNTGSAVLRPARVTDTLPASLLRIVSARSTLGSCRVRTAGGSRQVQCRAPAFAPGQSLAIHITAQATAAGSASDRAAVGGIAHAVASATVRISGPPPPAVTG